MLSLVCSKVHGHTVRGTLVKYRWAIQARPSASPPRTPTTHNLAHPVRRVAAVPWNGYLVWDSACLLTLGGTGHIPASHLNTQSGIYTRVCSSLAYPVRPGPTAPLFHLLTSSHKNNNSPLPGLLTSACSLRVTAQSWSDGRPKSQSPSPKPTPTPNPNHDEPTPTPAPASPTVTVTVIGAVAVAHAADLLCPASLFNNTRPWRLLKRKEGLMDPPS